MEIRRLPSLEMLMTKLYLSYRDMSEKKVFKGFRKHPRRKTREVKARAMNEGKHEGILLASSALLTILPPELVLQILDHLDLWILTSSASLKILDRESLTDVTNLRQSLWDTRLCIESGRYPGRSIRSVPLSATQAKCLRKVVFEFSLDHEHPWYYVPDAEVVWWPNFCEVEVRNNEVCSNLMGWNLTRGWKFERPTLAHEIHHFEPGKEDPLVKRLKEGDSIELKICVPFNSYLRAAKIEIWCVDDWSMGNDMNWIEEDTLIDARVYSYGSWRNAGRATDEAVKKVRQKYDLKNVDWEDIQPELRPKCEYEPEPGRRDLFKCWRLIARE